MTRLVYSLALVVCFTAVAVADMGPPPPPDGFKRVPYENTLKLESEVPGYKFYTFQRLGIGGRETIGDELQLKTDRAVPVPSSSSPSVRTGVVAVPDKVVADLRTKENLAKLLSQDRTDKFPAGVVVFETRGTLMDLKASDPRTRVENVIAVSPDHKAGVKFAALNPPMPPGEDADPEPGDRPTWAPLIAGTGAALGVVTLGVWYFRRK